MHVTYLPKLGRVLTNCQTFRSIHLTFTVIMYENYMYMNFFTEITANLKIN